MKNHLKFALDIGKHLIASFIVLMNVNRIPIGRKLLRSFFITWLMMLGGSIVADDSTREAAIASVYDHAGIHAHLSWVHSTVLEETERTWQGCEVPKIRSEIEVLLQEHLSIDSLQQGFLAQLNDRINEEQLANITNWIKSDVGKKIYQAEVESLNFDESTFETQLEQYKQSSVSGDARNKRLKHMLADTGAVYFLSALNTELSALVAIASVCSSSEDDLAAANKQVRQDRGAEALYRTFMRQELLLPSAVVYQNISNDELDLLSEFANSDAGSAYYTALIKGIRSLLSERVDRLSKALEAMPKSNH